MHCWQEEGIGIIDQGVLLEESDMETLEKKNSGCLEDYFKKITGGKGLLRLIQTELMKLRRRTWIAFMLLAALLMPSWHSCILAILEKKEYSRFCFINGRLLVGS